MDVRKGMLWYLVNGAMELSWFLGSAMFCSLAIMHRPFPFFETIVAFALAGFVTHLSTGKGWPVKNRKGIRRCVKYSLAIRAVSSFSRAKYRQLIPQGNLR